MGMWITELLQDSTTAAHALVVVALVAGAGMALGAIKVRGVGLGVAGVLFAGLAAGHAGLKIEHGVLDFMRELGLILFVYAIGIQVGPGFLASLRQRGLPMNLMAAGVVILGAAITAGLAVWRFDRSERPAAIGVFSGATTNTPSLAAARQAMRDRGLGEAADLTTVGYAVAYPFGIAGVIGTMLLVRVLFRVNIRKEVELLDALEARSTPPLGTRSVEVSNANLDGLALKDVPGLAESQVVVSRLLREGESRVVHGGSTLRLGDVLLMVGPEEGLERAKLVIGRDSAGDPRAAPGELTTRRILVTRSEPLGRSIPELDLLRRFGVAVTRITRGEVQLSPRSGVGLQFGDSLLAVGSAEALREVAGELGDSPRSLQHPPLIPMFVGIGLGVVLGTMPIHLPGLPAPVKLGLAGGPLLVALVLSRLGHVGPLVWYMPASASALLRELGMALFLTAVGIASGDQFVAALRGPGLEWMAYGVLITLVPILLVAVIARAAYGLNYLHICGLLAGSMTDPPALAMATSMTRSEASALAYATVYPLVMLLRVLAAQGLVFLLL